MQYDASKPLPVPDPESAPFWEAAGRGQLMIQRCNACGTVRFPATTYCPSCRSDDYGWVNASGRGRVFSWIVVRHPVPASAYKNDVPYVVALVTLDEGPRMVANIIGCAPDSITADMRVSVSFADAAEGFKIPVFQPEN